MSLSRGIGTTDQSLIDAAADRLLSATARLRPCVPVRDLIGRDDLAAAYAVQDVVNRARLAGGVHITGRKIGLTAEAVRRQLGVDSPDAGVLFSDMEFRSGDSIRLDTLLQPRVEAEIVFVLSEDVTDPSVDATQVRTCVGAVLAGLEVVDSRIAGWDISLADTVADNASCGMYVLGTERLTLDRVEPRDVPMVMNANGMQASAGSGAACLGDPLAALAWLARTTIEFGEPLRAGQVVLSGALGPMVDLRPGMHIAADLGPLGTVTASFE